MTRRLLCVFLSLLLLLPAASVLAEAAEVETPAPEDAAPAPEDAAPAADETAEPQPPVLLVTINGEEIYSDNADVEYWADYYLYQLSNSGYDVSDPELQETVNQYALYSTMRFKLIHQKAAELGLDQFTDAEKAEMEQKAKQEWAEIIESYMAGYGITEASSDDDRAAARADAEAALKEEGYDEAAYVSEYVESDMNNTLINRLQDYVSEGITVTDEEVQEYYQALVDEDTDAYSQDIGGYEFYTQYYQQPSYYTPEGYRAVNHILLEVDEELLNKWKDLSARYEEQQAAQQEAAEPVDNAEEAAEPMENAEETAEPVETAAAETPEPQPTEEPITAEMVEAARQAVLDSVQPTVDEIMGKLEKGASFDDLIVEYGTDPGMLDKDSRAEGYKVHKDSIIWDPAFTAAAMELEKIGDVGKPVVGQNGVHILHYVKDVPGGPVELTDEMKEEFRATMLAEKKTEALNTALEQWMNEADIVYTEEGEAWKLVLEEAPAEDAEAAETVEATETVEAVEPAAEEAAPAEAAPEAAAP